MTRDVICVSLVAAVLFGCPDDEECSPQIVTSEETCETTQDCIDKNLDTLSCVSGVCRRPCVRDRDCVLEPLDSDDPCLNEVDPQKPAVCEDQLCQDGCQTDADCDGLTCGAGRCVQYFESFEQGSDGGAVTFQRLGFNDVPKELINIETVIVWEGPVGCASENLGADTCAGFAADGVRYVALEAVATPEKGTADETAPTCRACACCLDCTINTPNNPPLIQNCPSAGLPTPVECPGSVPAVCTDVCNQCEGCAMAANRNLGDGLVSCEETAARRTCSACPNCLDPAPCDSCRAAQCQTECPPDKIFSRTCAECEAMSCAAQCTDCRNCEVCAEADRCKITDPGSSDCAFNTSECAALGAEGCFQIGINFPRAEPTDLEQSLVSPAIDLSGVTGPLTLQFEYIPFNIAETYFPGIQGTPSSSWPEQPQEVVVGLCAASCEQESNWMEATFVNGARASFPPAIARRNGLSLGRQGELDWAGGRTEVDIPESMRTAGFRFRFLPRLSKDARVGLDNILIRSRR